MKNSVLVIAPHADDEILGCGATMAKLAAEGNDVYVLIVTNASVGAPELYTEQGIAKIRREAKEAHQILGVKDTFFMDFPAPRLDTYPSYKISMEISKLFEKLMSEIIFIPGLGDLHMDHAVLYRACLVSARPINNYSIKKIYTYETLSETNWAPQQGGHAFVPNVYVDVTDFLPKKLEALQCFKNQTKLYPHCRSLEAIEALAKYRGSTVGKIYSEAFMVERIIIS